MGWMVARKTCLSRAHVNGGGVTVVRWDPNPYWGVHPTNLAAKRRYIEEYWPETKGHSDAFMRQFWRGEPTQAMGAKIVKVTGDLL
jgi:hypothetical protein